MLTVKELNDTMHHFGNSNKFNHISQVLFSTLCMELKNLLAPHFHNILMILLLLFRLLNLQLFFWMQEKKKLDVYSYSHYIRFMANKLDAATVLKLYNSIQDESVKDNVYVCNSVLRCLIKKGKMDTAIKLFQQMKQDGLVPDGITYSTV